MKPSSGKSSGVITKSLDITGFTLTELSFQPNHRLSKHLHEDPGYCLLLDGSYAENYRHRKLTCKPWTVLFRPPGEPHSNDIQVTGAHCFTIEPRAHWLANLRDRTALRDGAYIFQGPWAGWFSLKIYNEFLSGEISPLLVEGLVLAIASDDSCKQDRPLKRNPPRWLDRAKEIVHDRFAEPLSIAEIAELVGVHPVYLAQLFRQHFRCTIGEYVRQLRIEFACRKIATSEASLVEVSLAAGFSNQAHFSRVFKRLTNMTPTKYRLKFRA